MDSAGQEQFREMALRSYKKAVGIILVYDLTDRSSYDNLNEWIQKIKENTSEDQCEKMILGNKCDLKNDIRVTEQDEESFCYCPHYRTSAKNGDYI